MATKNKGGHTRTCEICSTERMWSVCKPRGNRKNIMESPEVFREFVRDNETKILQPGNVIKIDKSKEAILGILASCNFLLDKMCKEANTTQLRYSIAVITYSYFKENPSVLDNPDMPDLLNEKENPYPLKMSSLQEVLNDWGIESIRKIDVLKVTQDQKLTA